MSIYEIERKFLLKNDSWKKEVYFEKLIEQYYLDENKVKFYLNMRKNLFFVSTGLFRFKLRLKDIEMKALKENLHIKNKAIRFRKSDNKYIFTLKIDIGQVGKNIEIERYITEKLHLLAKSIAISGISKLRSLVKFKSYIFEIDQFYENNEGVELAEVEVNDLKQPEELPEWIGEEVTGNPLYFNSVLAKN